jgi:hypothetical protein
MTVTRLSDLANPSMTTITAVFGRQVDEVAKMGPPREPDASLLGKWGKFSYEPLKASDAVAKKLRERKMSAKI